ncbi:FtsW/RodA/SpoVE family cell cycle protein [Tessaracoccus sp. OH4464_COT-324]|uniref:FtsW/RodA/SpoVE family cell cycle protein n=1 Tax=Tessaracoccus sp. OH4464_COT-324 TaxID=2491059 RepID=UPI000F637DC3|nr:putative peptidoglycan glycosyltransferase FtsW [Tessaracoccus sp. OH4464_COT-324]RRD47543.1 cell division protein FtsW [Tessaracoccus sp. OH4464_COT-324]
MAKQASPVHASNRSQFRALIAAPTTPLYLVIASVAFLVSLGTLMVLSSSSVVAEYWKLSPYYFVVRQALILAVALLAAWVLARLSAETYVKLGWAAWVLSAVLLTAVLVVGDDRFGNRNWLTFGPISIQPSEFAKLGLIVFAAALLHRRSRTLNKPWALLIPLAPMALILFFLILAGRDVGTGLIMATIAGLIMWFIGTPMRILAPAAALGLGLMALLVFGSDNRSARIAIFLNPDSNPDLASQPMSALYALSSGGVWGVGLGASRQKWGGLQTGPHTDYIFAVIGEELGLFGSLAVLLAFAVFGFAGMLIAMRSDSLFCQITAASITGWMIVQAAVNIFVVMNLLPVLGVPLPFMSYGGSSLLASMMAVGVLISCARNTPDMRKHLEAKRRAKRTLRRRMTSVMAATKGDS